MGVFLVFNSVYSFCCRWVHGYYLHVILFGFFVMVFVSVFSFFGGFTYSFDMKRSDSRMVEFGLQLCVIGFLVLMTGPGFWLVQYQGLAFRQSELSLKVVGQQWYWSYSYGDSNYMCFDSFMKSLDDLSLGDSRLYEVDNRCVVPVEVNLGFYCTSNDVVHSFSIPKCFIKMDALSGLLTKVSYCFPMIGLFYGQCSEICGANHSFMPVVLEVVSLECWKGWCLEFFGL